MGEQPARWVHLAQFMDISGFRGVFGGEIGSVTSKHFRLDDNGIPVYIPYPLGKVTVSIGVATYHAGDSRKRLVARADQAMYKAKEEGRNRVKATL